MKAKRPVKGFDYDVALSFAGEDRPFVEGIADTLTECDVRVFYDEYFADRLWGKDLYQHLQEIYRDKARFCVVFVSRNTNQRSGRSMSCGKHKNGHFFLIPNTFCR
jgi:hypothetical protein